MWYSRAKIASLRRVWMDNVIKDIQDSESSKQKDN